MPRQAEKNPPDDFYEKIKPRLHQRIGRELRLAGRILDLGCGACDLVRYLARTYHQNVTGVDISDGSFPRRHHTSNGFRFRCIQKNATQLNFVKDMSMDAVVSMWAFHEMEHPEAILAEAHRILRPGGELLIVDFPKDSLAQQRWNEDYYSLETIKQMVSRGDFDDVRAKGIEQGQVMWITGRRNPNHKDET